MLKYFMTSLIFLTSQSWALETKRTQNLLKGSLDSKAEIAILAGGCFWGMEEIIRKIPGVISTDVGYSGGDKGTAKYNKVSSGSTKHAEAVRVYFNPEKLKFEQLLDYFFRMHNPTTLNQQGNDKGPQYRSVIFYQNDSQLADAKKVIQDFEKRKFWKKPIVTELTKFKSYTLAEEYHQDYLQKNPKGYTCHWLREEKE